LQGWHRPTLSTPALPLKVAEAQDFDTGDKVLLKTLTYGVTLPHAWLSAVRR